MTETVPWTPDDMLEIEFDAPDQFNVIRETLTRMGTPAKRSKLLRQACVIFHKKGRYYLCHVKEMFLFDGEPSLLTEDDIRTRNAIARILQDEYEMLTILDPPEDDECSARSSIRVLKHAMVKSGEWKLHSDYEVGRNA